LSKESNSFNYVTPAKKKKSNFIGNASPAENRLPKKKLNLFSNITTFKNQLPKIKFF